MSELNVAVFLAQNEQAIHISTGRDDSFRSIVLSNDEFMEVIKLLVEIRVNQWCRKVGIIRKNR